MTGMPFHVVDVFAEERFSGNQLAVFRPGRELGMEFMQRVAREMNFSESTFVASSIPVRGGYPVRIFTPRVEIPFAGHPVLGTVFVIQQVLIRRPVDEVVLHLPVGLVPVRISYKDCVPSRLSMKQPAPRFGQTFEREEAASALSLAPSDLMQHPVEEVSTGLSHIIVPVRNLSAMRRINLQRKHYEDIISRTEAKAILAFCLETCRQENQVNVRMFAPRLGIEEDPATGSGGGCLAAYLLKHRVLRDAPVRVRAEQGFQMGRPSLLYLEAREEDSGIRVDVGGGVVPVAEGRLVQELSLD